MSRRRLLGGLLFASACTSSAPEPAAVPALRIRQPEATPVSGAEWTTPDGKRSRVVAEGPDGERIATDWVEGSGEAWDQPLLGLAAGTDYLGWIELEDGTTFGEVSFTTDALPTRFAEWSTEGVPGWRGWTLSTVLGSIPRPVLLDEHARVAWYGPELPEQSTPIRSAFRAEGDGVWTLVERADPADNELVATSWTGEELARHPAAEWTHDFHPLASGGMLWLQTECYRLDGIGPVCGVKLMQGTPGEDRKPLKLWSAFDSFDPTTDGTVGADADWVHANALDVDEGARLARVGLRGLNAIVEIDLSTREVVRQIGGPHSSYAPADELATFDGQHQFEFYGDGKLVVHDNRATGDASRVVTLQLDDEAGTASTIEVIELDPPVWVFALGDVDRATSGTYITWSTAGVVTEHAPTGEERWRATAGLGTAFAYSTRTTELPGMAPVEGL